MKRYLILALLTAFTVVMTACTKDNDPSNHPGKLEIELAPSWDITRGMTSSSQTARITVTLNTESVYWRVSSDSEWCVVDSEQKHQGSGAFTITVTANDDFKTRNAIVTFTAGSYEQRIAVDQSGNIFILDRNYSIVAPGDTGSFEVQVKTLAKWEPVDSEWIHGQIISSSEPDENGMITSTLRITCDANTDQSGRYGTLTLEPTDNSGYSSSYAVYQFGSEVTFDEQNKLCLEAADATPFSIIAPADAVIDVIAPIWITYEQLADAGSGTTTYSFKAANNPSDTKSEREASVELTIRDITTKTLLPTLRQNYYTAQGIVSAAGLKLFAAAVSNGEDISYWQTGEGADKAVNVLCDIDMTGIEEWTAIGNETHPFNDVFKGNNFAIKGWTSTQPLFGQTGADASISDLTIDTGCQISTTGTLPARLYLGAFVGTHGGLLKNCVNRAPITVRAATASRIIVVGGMAGWVNGGRIESCTNWAAVNIEKDVNASGTYTYAGGIAGRSEGNQAAITGSTNRGNVSNGAIAKDIYTGGISAYAGCPLTDNVNLGGVLSHCPEKKVVATDNNINYIGGIAGYAAGSVSGSTNRGPVSSTALYTQTELGGVAGNLADGATIDNCHNEGALSTKRTNDTSVVFSEYGGGVAGTANGNITSSTNKGAYNCESSPRHLRLGGIAGLLNKEYITLRGNTNSGNVTASGQARYNFIGGLYGCTDYLGKKAQRINDTGSSNSGDIFLADMENVSNGWIHVGGVIGYLSTGDANPSELSGVKNTGAITIELKTDPAQYGIGGVAGVADGDVKSAVNEGAILLLQNCQMTATRKIYLGGVVGWNEKTAGNRISECVNRGKVNIKAGNNTYTTMAQAYVGGVLGYSKVDVTVAECSNTGNLDRNGANARMDNIPSATGGVVGAIDGSAARIENCTSTADVRHYQYNNSVVLGAAGLAGGVIGSAVGADQTNRVVVVNCSSSSEIENKRSYTGGIAGYLKFASAERCRFTGATIGAGPSYSGGIAGGMADAAVTACVVKSECIYGYSNPYGSGGIVGRLQSGGTVADSKIFSKLVLNTAAKTGAGMVAGFSEEGTTISSCAVGGEIRKGTNTSSTVEVTLTPDNFNAYITSDAKAAVSGCTYWNGTEVQSFSKRSR